MVWNSEWIIPCGVQDPGLEVKLLPHSALAASSVPAWSCDAGLLQLTRLLFFSATQVCIVCEAMCSRHCAGERKLEENK